MNAVRVTDMRRAFKLAPAARRTATPARRKATPTLEDRLARRLSRTWPVRRAFGNAWVLMDRIHDGGRQRRAAVPLPARSRRDINAWFVIEEGTPDWKKLKAEGYNRVVAARVAALEAADGQLRPPASPRTPTCR